MVDACVQPRSDDGDIINHNIKLLKVRGGERPALFYLLPNVRCNYGIHAQLVYRIFYNGGDISSILLAAVVSSVLDGECRRLVALFRASSAEASRTVDDNVNTRPGATTIGNL